jgi:archaeosine-15-forming tRNA-guanine transglycosylase
MSERNIEGEMPSRRLVISDEAVPFVSRGGRIFLKQVIGVDPDIHSGEVVQVVDRRDHLLTVAKAILTPDEIDQIRRCADLPSWSGKNPLANN